MGFIVITAFMGYNIGISLVLSLQRKNTPVFQHSFQLSTDGIPPRVLKNGGK